MRELEEHGRGSGDAVDEEDFVAIRGTEFGGVDGAVGRGDVAGAGEEVGGVGVGGVRGGWEEAGGADDAGRGGGGEEEVGGGQCEGRGESDGLVEGAVEERVPVRLDGVGERH